MIKGSVRRWLGRRIIVGAIEYYWRPERGIAWGGPFNGQAYRVKIFEWIVGHIQPVAIIETGTYRGTTTELMVETGLPVYTIEGNPRHYGFARARLVAKHNVTLRLGDSRVELRSFFKGPLRPTKSEAIFAYLDAHWDDDLPLAEELDIIFGNSSAAVVMIDDFQVPDDLGYSYDVYGPDRALTAAYLAPAIAKYELRVFYPSIPSHNEGGSRRGCVVLVPDAVHGEALMACPLLRTV